MIFKNRVDAGEKLGEKIKQKYPQIQDGVILGLPRGGVVVAKEVAKILELPFDIIVTRKIGAIGNPEFAIGAVSEHEVILSDPAYAKSADVQSVIAKEHNEIQRRLAEYRTQKAVDLKGRKVILVDDGLATGKTIEVAIKEIKRTAVDKLILAMPVSPPDTAERLCREVDDCIILSIEPLFMAVGQFYQDFSEVNDQTVKKLLE